jgi:hypothetical protein
MAAVALQDQFRAASQEISARLQRTVMREEISMLDLIMLALGLGFFVAALGYTYACERL